MGGDAGTHIDYCINVPRSGQMCVCEQFLVISTYMGDLIPIIFSYRTD